MDTRDEITGSIDDNILTGGRRTTADKTRTVLDLMNNSYGMIEAAEGSGTQVEFSEDRFYGTTYLPEDGNITADLTGAKVGVSVLIIHQGTMPTFGSEFLEVSTSDPYDGSKINYIYCIYLDDTHILYSISHTL